MPVDEAEGRRARAEAERLLAALRPRLASLARAFARGSAEAEDLEQEMALAILRDHPRYRSEGAPEAWAGRVALNVCRMHARRRRLERSIAEKLATEGLPVTRASGPAAPDELTERVELALAQLDSRQAEAIRLRAFAGYSYAEIAAALGLSKAVVKVTIFRARRSLAQLLGPHLEANQ
jgi:RNA polymerase sigma-70 factor (ECF subfamily)